MQAVTLLKINFNVCLGWDTSQIPQWSENSKYKSHRFEILQ